jgi:hypothetical protein
MKKSGHSDVQSSKKLCKTIIEDVEDILINLKQLEDSHLPTWWTNKLAVSAAYLNSLRDYITYTPQESESEEEEDEIVNQTITDNTYIDSSGQLTIGNYTTSHFDICPSAQKLYSNITTMTDMIHLVVESMMLQDSLFRLEKQAIAMGTIDSEMLSRAQRYADMIMYLAEEMDLKEEHSYIEDVHMAKFKELVSESKDDDDEDDEDYMLPPSARMLKNATKKR